jgi:hypothetical protein
MFKCFRQCFKKTVWIGAAFFTVTAFSPFNCSKSPVPGSTAGPTLKSIAVTAPAGSLAGGGGTLQLAATGTYSDGSTADLTSKATWSAAAPGSATAGTVSASGLYASGSGGALVTVTAVDGGVSGTLVLKVTGLVTAIADASGPITAYARPASPEVWVTNSDRTISIIDTTTLAIAATIPDLGAGKSISSLLFTPDGSKAYVSTAGNTVETINASARTLGTPVSVSGPTQLALGADGTTLFVLGDGFIDSIASGVASLFTNAGSICTVGMTTVGGHLYRAEQCHPGGDFIYEYPSQSSTTGGTSFAVTGWVAGNLFASPDGKRLFATVGNGSCSAQVIDPSDNTVLQAVGFFGSFSFFGDGKRTLMSRYALGPGACGGSGAGAAAQDYAVYDYSGNTLTLDEAIPVVPISGGGVTADGTLFLPESGTGKVQVYQE